MQYLHKIWKSFIDSFKYLRISYLIVIAYEILFFLAVVGIFILFQNILINIAANFSQINPYALSAENVSAMRAFFVQSIAATIGMLLLAFIAYVILQGFAWLQIVGGKHTWRYFWRFIVLNFAWLIPWVVLMWFFVTGLKGVHATVGLLVLAIFFVHLTFIMQHSFAKDPNLGIKSSIGKAFSIGIGKIHWFIIPYVLGFVVFMIWGQIWRLIPQTNPAFGLIILSLVIFAPFLAWFKFYLHRLLTSFA